MSSLSDLELARACREGVTDKKAFDPVLLDLSGLDGPATYFLICSADSDPQIKAIANHLETTLKETHQIRPWRTSGTPASRWMIIDYGAVMVHIFHQEKRRYYRLEELWSDAQTVT
jgi:ribosome-associated protein